MSRRCTLDLQTRNLRSPDLRLKRRAGWRTSKRDDESYGVDRYCTAALSLRLTPSSFQGLDRWPIGSARPVPSCAVRPSIVAAASHLRGLLNDTAMAECLCSAPAFGPVRPCASGVNYGPEPQRGAHKLFYFPPSSRRRPFF